MENYFSVTKLKNSRLTTPTVKNSIFLHVSGLSSAIKILLGTFLAVNIGFLSEIQSVYAASSIAQATVTTSQKPSTPPACKTCLTDKVVCNLDACPPGAGACYSSSDCTINLSASMCALMGYTNGQTTTPAACIQKAENGNPPNSDQAFDLCSVAHECTHARDPECANGNMCQTEVNAYGETAICEAKYYNANCAPTGTGWTTTECNKSSRDINRAETREDFNQCVCLNNSCDICIARCAQTGMSLADCKVSASLYCKPTANPSQTY